MLTKTELLFVAEKAETYINPYSIYWVLPSCPIANDRKFQAEEIAKLSKNSLRKYGWPAVQLAVLRAGKRKVTGLLLADTFGEIRILYEERSPNRDYSLDLAKKPRLVAKRLRRLAEKLDQ